ncbi:two-component sensor histidine kinase [Mycobacterium sp. CBMA293]|uniref:sensor histidine kinase n=1 Tax=unclassified Mycolicibacterium TaxID=2636767 RepID=UPI0012DFC8F1|nr:MULTISPECIES: histidine kinase [unclassified Mycolicibacterium]MUL44382.1 two-component sensor histidine kinase [Mycolicibacterium sp. CBMA 360]MUL59700.1 two-component sensor histidine kinase [Mycolicibacterium sp. CBMA 335]MUL68543.1 two-component sensor histidine kinase [Mycolicibacterium sp. CBMA 311]MUL97196.1 two-component sensor histidine kinase [Mycolicibacterium sp. CBMA 230]MUM06313.1 two-component sensor histidine kinase [Mycolicibacterium sp. CBMA 213]
MDWLRDFALRRRGLMAYQYPLTVPIVMYTGSILVAGTAAIQRDFTQPWLLTVAVALVFAPIGAFIVGGYKPTTLVTAASVLTGVTLLLLCWPPVFLDATPFLLMFMLGEVFALGSVRDGLTSAAGCALLLFGASRTGHVTTFVPYLLFFLAIAAMIGHILQLQQRLVLEERARQAALTDQAAADERRRIAREIHDVIAHSLSVTMLHLTGARRALQEDDDVDDAVDALLDAERLGRQAMSDIRHTVGLLSAGEGQPLRATPEPDMSDIPDLVASFAAAGLKVDSRIDADPAVLTAGVGLALFRVTQESLANIAKHAPESAVQVRLCHDNGIADLSVHNDLPDTASEVKPGAGLPGMRQRIEMLGGEFHAGPEPTGWTVQARVPVAPATTPHACAMQRIGLLRSEIHHD